MSISLILVILFGLMYIFGITCIIISMIVDKETVTIQTLPKPRNYYPSTKSITDYSNDFNLDNLVDDDDASVIISDSPS